MAGSPGFDTGGWWCWGTVIAHCEVAEGVLMPL
jgi:hypothetical protein